MVSTPPTDSDVTLEARIAAARQSVLAGNFNEAKALCEILRNEFPSHIELLNLSSVIEIQIGNIPGAITLLREALLLNPNSFKLHLNLGNAMLQSEDLDQAVEIFEKAASIEPENPIVHFNLGLALFRMAKYEDARLSFTKANILAPDDPEILQSLGAANLKLKRHEDALFHLAASLKIRPDFAEALYNYGFVLLEQKKPGEAKPYFGRAVAIRPRLVEAHLGLSMACYNLEEYQAALDSCNQAIELKPDYAEAYAHRGNAISEIGNHEAALSNFARAIELKPDYADAFFNQGAVLQQMARYDEAIISYGHAIRGDPEHVEARFNMSTALLVLGRFIPGWAYYETRLKTGEIVTRQGIAKPKWQGWEALSGKRIMLWGEQGYGDQIQFVRYAKLLAAQGAKVLIEVDKPLIGLFSRLCAIERVTDRGTPLPDTEFDFHCPLMSLPHLLGSTLETIPEPPRVTADQARVERWKLRLGARRKLRVGVAWRGRKTHKNDQNRSIELGQFCQLYTADLDWFVIQKEITTEDKDLLSSFPHVKILDEHIHDFEDTAALISEMDLIISVDTSLVHLAGTMKKPCWVLLPFNPDWRWLLDREDTPWYPTLKLFRQKEPKDWAGVIYRVQHAIRNWGQALRDNPFAEQTTTSEVLKNSHHSKPF